MLPVHCYCCLLWLKQWLRLRLKLKLKLRLWLWLRLKLWLMLQSAEAGKERLGVYLQQ